MPEPMAPAERARRATSFGAAADLYDRFRPPPPPEVAEWLVPGSCRRVVDLGAGTGGFSRVLRSLGHEVVAVDPDLRMAAVAAAKPGVSVVAARAEALPVAAGCCDALVVSSAWHWMDPTRALAEVATVLRPGGVFGVVWNGADRTVDWVGELLAHPGTAPSPRGRRSVTLVPGGPLGHLERRVFTYSLPRTPPQLVGLAATYSGLTSLSAEERERASQAAAERIAQHLRLAGRSTVALPMRAVCWRAVRLEG